jgi:YidC/Oxa1 family membrane protein insertase
MEKRVLLAISLSFVVLFAYQMLVPKPAAKTLPPRPNVTGPSVAGSATPAGASGTGAAAAGATATPSVAQSGTPKDAATSPALEADRPSAPTGAAARVSDTVERDIVVDTNHVHAVFSNRGALVKSWTLKHYLDATGKPIDVTPPVTTTAASRPFAISVPDERITQTLQSALYKPSADSLDVGDGTQSLRFDYEDASGLVVKKVFEFQPNGKPYVVSVTVSVTQGGQAQRVTVHGGAGLGDLERAVKPAGFFHPSNYQQPEAIFEVGKDVTRVPYTKLAAQPVHEGPYRYAGVDDHYFLGALLSDGVQPTRVDYTTLEVLTSTGPRDLVDFRVQVNGGSGGPLKFFYGPKDFDILQSTDKDLELVRAINFGMFSFLAVPLLRALKWINVYIGNFGWSIILLTVGINLVLFPLRHKSVVSMRRMQEVQPEAKAIQDRYAKLKVTDPARQKMQTELMALYKERGVNPASGCVPMLLTLPVLFAFYSLLSVAIELRGAPFALWIHDLSRYDPYFVTPVLMGITQFWQTRLTPTTGDPAQQRMMMLMPLMFMVFFVWAPSGLVIYWFVSNLWSIGQTYLTNQLIGPPPPRVLRPVAERRVKRAERPDPTN